MTPDILEDVQRAHAQRYGRRDAAKVRRSPEAVRLCEEAKAVVTRYPALMEYLNRRYLVTRMEQPPAGVSLADWQMHRASEAGVVSHLYDLALTRTEEQSDG